MKPDMEPVSRPRSRARESYNNLSRWYDRVAGSETKFINLGIRLLNVQPGESILEIGCGTGRALTEFANKATGGMVIAVDVSEKMLTLAREKISTGRVGFCQADGLFLPYMDEVFDAAFLSFTLELFDTPEIPKVLGECHRVLKPTGRMGIVSLAKQNTFAVRIYEWFHRRLPVYIDCRPIHLRPFLEETRFVIQRSMNQRMWGLPVDIVVATRTRRTGV
jgi:demethylmenaquinone methyltransferase/2-methoxy-6-polyprenyl-1,4-benzoquinol methylase